MKLDYPLLALPSAGPGARLRVLVVHPNALLRRGLREIIADHADIAVVAEAADGHEAAQVVRALGPDGLDLALVDIGARRSWGSAASGLGVATVLFSMSALRGGRFRGIRIGPLERSASTWRLRPWPRRCARPTPAGWRPPSPTIPPTEPRAVLPGGD